MMILTTEVIMTFDDNTQKKFNHRTGIVNDKNCSSYGLEKMLIKQIVFHSDEGKLNHLVKLSLCVYAKDNTEEVMNNTKISSIFKSEKNGKYYFQSDKRCAVVEELCKEYPEIAKDVPAYKMYAHIHNATPFDKMIRKCKDFLFNKKDNDVADDDAQEEAHFIAFYTKKESEVA